MTQHSIERVSYRDKLPAVRLNHASGASALVCVYAAHLVSWSAPDGVELLYVSSSANLEPGSAIRGGVPICWPQFSDRGPLAKHGFVRSSDKWTVVRTSTEPFPVVVLEIKGDDLNADGFPSAYKLQYSVSLDSANSISTALAVINTGDEPFEFNAALHTYFGCSDVTKLRVAGLQGTEYEDAVASGTLATQREEELEIRGEVDRVYRGAPADAYLIDGERAVRVLKMGFPDAVVWNIGEERAPGIGDLAAGEWQRYVCYEAAAIAKPVKLAPSSSWRAGQTFFAIKASEVPRATAA